jgi:hypothetical protein
MKRDKPFVSGLSGEDAYWDGNTIQEELDNIYIFLEAELDEFPGYFANMLRLQRFTSWYSNDGSSAYMAEWKRILSHPRTYTLTGSTLALEQRHASLLNFNPLSANMQKMRLQLGLPSHLRKPPRRFLLGVRWSLRDCMYYVRKVGRFEQRSKLSRVDVQAGAKLKSCWSREAWRDYYPEGIPPLDLALSDFNLTMRERGVVRRMSDGDVLKAFARMGDMVKRIDFGRGEKVRGAL